MREHTDEKSEVVHDVVHRGEQQEFRKQYGKNCVPDKAND